MDAQKKELFYRKPDVLDTGDKGNSKQKSREGSKRLLALSNSKPTIKDDLRDPFTEMRLSKER